MDAATAEGFRALRRLEFELAFPRRLMVEGVLPGTLDRLLLRPAVAIFVLAALAVCAALRGVGLPWQHVSLPVTLIIGLVWGLAGFIPLLGAGLAGVTFDPRYQGQAHLRPGADLLPLDESQALTARCQGRALAFGVYLLAGIILGLIARALMGGLHAVAPVPGLADPWHVAAVEAFALLTLAGIYLKLAARRVEATGAAGLMMAYMFTSYPVVVWGVRQDLFVFGQWNIVAGTTLALAAVIWVSLLAHVLYLGWCRRVQRREPPDAAAAKAMAAKASRRVPDVQGAGIMLELETAHAGEMPRMLRRGVSLCLRLTLGIAAGLLAIQAAALLVGLAYAAWHRLPQLPPEVRDSPDAVLGFALVMLGMVLAIMLPLTAWSEQMPMGGSLARHLRRPGVGGPHLAGLLPVPPQRRWRRRLLWLVGAEIAVGVAGLAACALVSALDQLLPWAPDLAAPTPLIATRVLPAIGLVALAALTVFAYGALLNQANRNVPVSGCLIFLLFYVGLFTGIPLAAAHRHGPPPLSAAAALAWLGLVLGVSLAGMVPGFWPRRPDGSRSLRTTIQALIITLSLPVTIGLGFRMFVAVTLGSPH